MPVEIFTLPEFESALPCHKDTGAKLWTPAGIIQGEHCYLLRPLPSSPFAILVRSSIGTSGTSAECGEDSIRAMIVAVDTLKPHGGKVARWTTRLPGWQERLTDKVLRPLSRMLAAIIRCPGCGAYVVPFKVKKEGPNKGRLFVSCRADGCRAPFYSFLDDNGNLASKPAPASKPGSISLAEAKAEQARLYHAGGENAAIGRACADPDSVPPALPCPKCGAACVVRTAGPTAKNPGKQFYACPNRCAGWIGWKE